MLISLAAAAFPIITEHLQHLGGVMFQGLPTLAITTKYDALVILVLTMLKISITFFCDQNSFGFLSINLLFTLMTCDCVPRYATNLIVKFADDIRAVGLIRSGGGAGGGLVQRQQPYTECGQTQRDLWWLQEEPAQPRCTYHFSSCVNPVSLKRAQQQMYFVHKMRRTHLHLPILTTFYRSTIQSILTCCFSVWCGGYMASDWKNVRRELLFLPFRTSH